MTVITQRQPYFIADTEAERDTGWPTNSLVFCKDTQLAYILTNGTFVGIHDNNADQYWTSGVKKTKVKFYSSSATVSSGTAVFNLTDDGIGSGNAVFTNIYKAAANFWSDDASNQYQYGGYTISANKKTLTVTVNKLGSVLLGIIQLVTAANGTTIYLSIVGD